MLEKKYDDIIGRVKLWRPAVKRKGGFIQIRDESCVGRMNVGIH